MGQTLAERLRDEGRDEGIAKGSRLTPLNLIMLKYGRRDEGAERRVMEASDAEIDRWVAGVLTATTLEELLGADA